MTFYVTGQGTIQYDNPQALDYRAGAEITGHAAGNVGFFNGTVGIGNAATARVKTGAEFTVYNNYKPYSNNGTRLGISIYGEGKIAYHFNKTHAEDNPVLDGAHKFTVDGGGGVEFIIHQSGIFEGAIGVKGGYRQHSYNNDNLEWTGTWTDNAMAAQLNPGGKAYVTPTAEVMFHVGKGVTIGAKADMFEASAGISYVF